ncbi:MAG TPA: hypothetical protein VFV99_10550 [Kofleriaceae bacterium]|nr:hypothetical protein [Kofleriaceae bacterium]
MLWLALAACGREQYHVRLDPPRPGITPQERVQLFWQRRPTAEGTVTTNDVETNKTLFLGDKQKGVEQVEVVSPEDLEPLVGADSETMEHARRSVHARNRSNTAWYASIVVLAGGFVLGIAVDRNTSDSGLPWTWITFGASAGTAVLLWSVERHWARDELEWRKRAFETYTRDLGQLLNVCAHGMEVVPCEAPINAPSDPSQPKQPATSIPGRTALLRMR